jgi:hypothetical protein
MGVLGKCKWCGAAIWEDSCCGCREHCSAACHKADTGYDFEYEPEIVEDEKGSKTYICKVCGRELPNSGSFNRHMMAHKRKITGSKEGEDE